MGSPNKEIPRQEKIEDSQQCLCTRAKKEGRERRREEGEKKNWNQGNVRYDDLILFAALAMSFFSLYTHSHLLIFFFLISRVPSRGISLSNSQSSQLSSPFVFPLSSLFSFPFFFSSFSLPFFTFISSGSFQNKTNSLVVNEIENLDRICDPFLPQFDIFLFAIKESSITEPCVVHKAIISIRWNKKLQRRPTCWIRSQN